MKIKSNIVVVLFFFFFPGGGVHAGHASEGAV